VAGRRGFASYLSVPPPRIAAPQTFIKEEERVQQLRRCLSAEALPGIVRTVGALLLLFGFPYTRLLGLTIHDVGDGDRRTSSTGKRAARTRGGIRSQP
jgi:hypothetical protein